MANTINLDLIKAKLAGLRVNELKEVLTKLYLSRSGNKPDLHKRIVDFFTDATKLTSQNHRLANENRLLTAAKAIDAVYKEALEAHHISWNQRQVVQRLEKPQGAAGSGGSSSTAAAAGAAVQPTAKRPRLDSSLAAEAQQLHTASTEVLDDVVAAFLNGNEGLGPQNTKVRCICSSQQPTEPLLQCEGSFCGVWQHALCVKQLDSSTDRSALPLDVQRQLANCKQRQQYFCERCRVARADPFWELFDPSVMAPAVALPTVQTRQLASTPPVTKVVCSTQTKRFVLTSRQLMLLRAKPEEYQLQAHCLQLDDEVQWRFHWPVAAAITCHQDGFSKPAPICINKRGVAVKMGPMQRDEPFNLMWVLPPGPRESACRFFIEFEHCDASHTYVLLVCLMRRRSTDLVKGLMKPPESLAAALQRVRQQLHGCSAPGSKVAAAAASPHPSPTADVGNEGAAAIDDDDDDDDIIIGNSVVSLKDPNSGTRIVQAARFTDTAGVLSCAFDLDTFLELAQRTRKWIDPHSSKPSSVQNLQVDSYLNAILKRLAATPDVTEVEINPEGLWRPAGSTAPFMSVQDDVAGSAAAAAASGVPLGADGESDIDEAAEMDEFRQAAAKLAAERAQREATKPKQQAQAAVEVIELLSDSDEDEPMQQQQQQQRQGGMVIRLPQRVAQPQQQQQAGHADATHGSAARTTAATAAAAVGSAVLHATASGGPHAVGHVGSSSSRRTQAEGTLAAAAGSGSADFGQQRIQQQQQQPGCTVLPRQVPGAAMLEQQMQAPSGFVVQGSGGTIMLQSSVPLISMPLQTCGPMSGGMQPPAVTQYLAQQQQQVGLQQLNTWQGPISYDQTGTMLPGQQLLQQQSGLLAAVSYQMPAPQLNQQLSVRSMPYLQQPQQQPQQQQQQQGLYQQGGMVVQQSTQPQYEQQQQGSPVVVVYASDMNMQQVPAYQQHSFAGYAGGRS